MTQESRQVKVGETHVGEAGATLKSQSIQGPQSRKNCEGRALGWNSPVCLGAVEAPCSGEEVCSPSDSTARPKSLELIPGQYALVFKKNKPLSPGVLAQDCETGQPLSGMQTGVCLTACTTPPHTVPQHCLRLHGKTCSLRKRKSRLGCREQSNPELRFSQPGAVGRKHSVGPGLQRSLTEYFTCLGETPCPGPLELA